MHQLARSAGKEVDLLSLICATFLLAVISSHAQQSIRLPPRLTNEFCMGHCRILEWCEICSNRVTTCKFWSPGSSSHGPCNLPSRFSCRDRLRLTVKLKFSLSSLSRCCDCSAFSTRSQLQILAWTESAVYYTLLVSKEALVLLVQAPLRMLLRWQSTIFSVTKVCLNNRCYRSTANESVSLNKRRDKLLSLRTRLPEPWHSLLSQTTESQGLNFHLCCRWHK